MGKGAPPPQYPAAESFFRFQFQNGVHRKGENFQKNRSHGSRTLSSYFC